MLVPSSRSANDAACWLSLRSLGGISAPSIAVGMAASICKTRGTTPRGVYEQYLPDLQKLMQRGAGKQ